MIFDIITIFPELLQSPLQEGIIRRALAKEQIEANIINLRDFASDRHQMTDDRPFGGGEGMVMKAEPLAAAVRSRTGKHAEATVVLLTPQGRPYTQRVAEEFAGRKHLILICGRYEGVDERFVDHYVDEEISIGDYILTGGELGAMVIIDSVTRLLPGVLGCSDSVAKDSFSRSLLKHSQYTRPRYFEQVEVPEALLSGDHARIEKFRFVESVKKTMKRRPDLIAAETFTSEERKLLKQHNLLDRIEQIKTKAGPTG
ncbi:tRNA (guanosine(37)-N1)-methyltransferase TrmD [Desulforhopalus singaporensis]|uniref:tRNA (guanine-N(1)-)-methyltransferase n=1 Tax=Desulforhopalus singaporensis TaxID=91360 RepID=A0A1H0MIK4_9BACT|nr:tRNA (guanosine(37)-N1)-methyltransferase TrmD [Desulforhopalus singaporensis]SDO80145.1 tRNA (Guanine37-N(1)-) methyltransferase [Desulforhopalus singaporensis]